MKHLKKIESVSEIVSQDYTVIYSTEEKVYCKKNQPIPSRYYEIWYTTTDGNIFNMPELGIPCEYTLLSNTYENGKGVMVFDQPIEKLGFETNEEGEIQKFYPFFSTLDEETLSTLKSIELPDSVTSIGENAFGECSSLTSIEIPSGVTSIGDYAFGRCSSLTSIELPSGLTDIGFMAFYYCTNLALTELPSGITSIGNDAFCFCTNLALTELPSGITSIGSNIFEGCTNLALTELPSGITSIGQQAFRYCSNLALTELPSGITSIEWGAFYECTNIQLAEIPSGVTKIGDGAFNYCAKITSLAYNGVIYTSKSALTTALQNNGVDIHLGNFYGTGLTA